MKHLISVFFVVIAILNIASASTTSSNRYEITKGNLHYRAFRDIPLTEKIARFNKIKFVKTLPTGTLAWASEMANFRLLYAARQQKVSKVAANIKLSAVSNISYLKSQGLEVGLMTAQTTDDIIAVLNLNPDFVVVSSDLDLPKVKEELLLPIHTRAISQRTWFNNFPLPRERAKGTTIRVMSYNILTRRWGRHMPPFSRRMPGIVDVIRNASPDFIGIQEMEPFWYDLLEKTLSPYRFACQPFVNEFEDICFTLPLAGEFELSRQYKSVMNGLMYDSSKYREITGGLYPYTDTIIRCLRWTLLENLKTRQRFILTNTHWNLTVPKRLQNSEIMVQSIKDLQQKYPGVPIICTGDFNCRIQSEELQMFLKATNFSDAATTAAKSENNSIFSYYPPQSNIMPIDNSGHIDHVIYSDKLEALESKMLINDRMFYISDHLPLNVDFKLKD